MTDEADGVLGGGTAVQMRSCKTRDSLTVE